MFKMWHMSLLPCKDMQRGNSTRAGYSASYGVTSFSHLLVPLLPWCQDCGSVWLSTAHLSFSETMTMPALNVCLQVAKIAGGSGIPYFEDLAKVAVTVFELLEVQKGKNKKAAKELSESIANTIVIIDSIVCMHRDRAGAYFEDVCGAMAGYLDSMTQDLKDAQQKHRGVKSFFNRKCVDDFRVDFLVIQVHSMVQALKDTAQMRPRDFGMVPEKISMHSMIQIAGCTAFFF
ncbi:hypothetical protein IW261DRAFT_1527148 [Armillaria novae-zelandiae]|uniref:Uncharacterized protein n=1 Tax=Armillaria novae-zelandiae TaxID=153914 RepID=A0AA39NC09_9AGAR|nr:hypothetical protein IW261DRAFT_1527148 [Armillaria novae-zelandiae]